MTNRARTSKLEGATAALALVLGIASAHADAAERAPSADRGSADVAMDEIIVTARKRAELLEQVPDAITAFTAEAITNAGIRSVDDVSALTPNMSFRNDQEVGVSTLSIRGVSQVRNGEPPVAFVIDGVQAANSLTTTQELFDIQQIEVLKGPQGALYGRNAIAGAINITTRRPTSDPEFAVRAGVAEGEDYSAGFTAAGALVPDMLLYRVSGDWRDRAGQLTNVTLGEKVDFQQRKAGRARLLWQASDALALDFRATVSRDKGGGGYYMPTEVSPLNGADTVRKISGDSLATTEVNFESYSLKVDYEFPAITLSSVTSFDDIRAPNSRSADPRKRYDIDNAAGAFINVSVADDSRTLTEELRATSKGTGQFRYVAGLFYQSQERDRRFDVYGNATFFTTFNPEPNAAVWIPLATNLQTLRNRAIGAFAQVNYDVNDQVELTVAGRYDRDRKRDEIPNPDLARTFSKFQPKVSLAYKPSSNGVVYATYSEGFRSGGFNNTATFGREYDPEELKNYELGFKQSWPAHGASLNGAVFYMDYRNLQSFLFDNTTGTQAIVTADKSRIQGFELEGSLSPVDGLLLQAAYGYTDGKLKSLGNVPGLTVPSTAFDGNVLKNMPRDTLNLVVQYSLPVTGDGQLVTRLDYQRTGKTYWELDNVDSQDPYGLLNLRVTLRKPTWSLALYANNLTDKKYDVYFFAKEFVGALVDIAWPSPPRQIGGEFSYRF